LENVMLSLVWVEEGLGDKPLTLFLRVGEGPRELIAGAVKGWGSKAA